MFPVPDIQEIYENEKHLEDETGIVFKEDGWYESNNNTLFITKSKKQLITYCWGYLNVRRHLANLLGMKVFITD